MTGEGEITVTESSLLRSTLFHELGRLTGIREFNNISFSTITAQLDIGDGGVEVDDLVMDTTWTNIEGTGWVGFDRSINFDVQMAVLRGMFRDIPVVSWIANLVNSAINNVFLSVRVEGSLDEPNVRVVQPLVDTIVR
jgi:hypothetical protein